MATTVSQPANAPWPHGKLVPIHLRTHHTGGDTSGFKVVDIHKAEFDFKIKRAFFSVREGSVAITGGIQIVVVDNKDTPQEIVAAFDITAAHDAGVPVDLTVAAHTPIFVGEQVALDFDSNTSDTIADLHVTLWVEPQFS